MGESGVKKTVKMTFEKQSRQLLGDIRGF